MKRQNYSKEIMIAAGEYTRERDYWLKKLAGEWVKVGFHQDFKGNIQGNGSREETVTFGINGDLFSRLMTLSNGFDYTLHMILVAAVELLLHKYTGSRDIILGTPIYKQDIDAQFINTLLPLRNRLEQGMTFKELLLQVRETIMEAAENQNYPIETLVYQLNLPYPADDFPLFDIMVLLENVHDRNYLKGINPRLIFSFTRGKNTLEGVLEYSALHFKKATIERIIGHFIYLLQGVLFNIAVKISSLEILSNKEKNQLLYEFNGTRESCPWDETIVRLFETQARQVPDTAAVIYQDRQLTYSELNVKANRLARLLRSKGVQREDIVGLMKGRSLAMITGIMAILKAGGAYLSIGTDYPVERIKFMLKDSDTRVLLTEKKYVGIDYKGEFIDVEDIKNDKVDSSNHGIISEPHGLAYVIYTSGSTGTPKGVLVEHRHVINLVYGLKEKIYNQYKGNLKVSLVAPYIFDASVQQVFAALLLGHSLYIVPENIRVDGELLVIFYNHCKIDITDGTPAHLRLMQGSSSSGENNLTLNLKHLIIGGEVLDKKIVTGFFNRFHSQAPKITNIYGPAECCVDVASYEITRESPGIYETIPIGKPMPHRLIYIVNRETHQLQPVGVPGELWISGEGVGRGYLNRPELTAEKFCLRRPGALFEKTAPVRETSAKNFLLWGPDKNYLHPCIHASMPIRLYRTGDLARWLPDGNIEFLARIDNQVKIRGFRVELGELENQVKQHPKVTGAVVLAKEDEAGDKYLCAYYVSPARLSVSELREHLARTLPDYMIPSYFTQLEKIPLTPGGKVDRRALPAPVASSGTTYVAPRNSTEEKLTLLWSAVLGIEKKTIGIDDSFFELGGQSLKATVLASEIHKEFDVKVPLKEIFDTPLIRGLAKFIHSQVQNKFTSIQAAEKQEYYFLSSAQKRLYILQQMELDNTTYNVPLTIEIKGVPSREKLAGIFKKLIKRHECLRTSFEMVNQEPIQRIHDEVAFEIENYIAPVQKNGRGRMTNYKGGGTPSLLRIPNYKPQITNKKETKSHHSSFIIHHSFIRPFDLSQAPLLRVGLVNKEKTVFIMLVDMHHIISDGVSLSLLINEFKTLVGNGTLPELRLQYKDFSAWQNQLFASGAIKQQEEYWLKQFSHNIPPFKWPAEEGDEGEKNDPGPIEVHTVGLRLSKDLKDKISKMSQETGTTLYMVLLAIYNILLAKYTDQEDILVGSPVFGRKHADLKNIIGMFVNMLAMRNYPQRNKTFTAFLKEVKENALNAFENQDYQFEQLVWKLDQTYGAQDNYRLEIDTVFVLENAGTLSKETPKDNKVPQMDLKLSGINPSDSKFNLTLIGIEEQNQLNLSFDYNSSLFKKETIRQMSRHFKNILEEVTANPQLKIARINMLDVEEKNRLIKEVKSETGNLHENYRESTRENNQNIRAEFDF